MVPVEQRICFLDLKNTDLVATGLSSEDFLLNAEFLSVLPWVNQCFYG